jgi:hypothetical protein
MMRRIGVAGVFAATALAMSACGGPPPGAIRGVGGESEITFTLAEGAGAKKYIILENVSLSTPAELGESYIEEGGVPRAETVFKVIAGIKSGMIEPCKFPTKNEQLEKKGGNCIIGVEFVAATRGRTAKYVQEYGTIGGTLKEAKGSIVVKSE